MDTRSFVTTADGSKTLYHAAMGEHYHSRHGAVQESRHVFIGMGLIHVLRQGFTSISILEVGLGTGLNFLLSADHCGKNGVALDYTGIEAYPLPPNLVAQTDYDQYISPTLWASFCDRYADCWKTSQTIVPGCTLTAIQQDIRTFNTKKQFNLLYFDAFASSKQPEMWAEATLRHVSAFLVSGGVFVTYAITGNLKRTMKELGFTVEKVPGAPGKREMLRAFKR